MSTFLRARAMGSILEATSNTWKNSFRSNSLSDRMSRPAKLRIGSSCLVPVSTKCDIGLTGGSARSRPPRFRVLPGGKPVLRSFFLCGPAASSTHAPNDVEVEVARDEITERVVEHLAARVIELRGELQQHVAPLDLQRLGDLCRRADGRDGSPRDRQL